MQTKGGKGEQYSYTDSSSSVCDNAGIGEVKIEPQEDKALADYKIARLNGGEFGIRAETDRAGNRSGSGRSTKGLTLGFKTGYEAVEFVKRGEEEGYTFEGKELLIQFVAA
jgi:hypothetical protein